MQIWRVKLPKSGREKNILFIRHFGLPNINDKVLTCEIDGAVVIFNQIASTGTQSLMLLYFWIKKFEVCKRLFSLNCQVSTSSYNPYLMTNDLLRPDCNFIVSDNKIKPLSECSDKELRFGHNIEKHFRGDAFQV